MRAADDVTYGDSDTATAGSDTGTHYSARRRRISSSIASVSTERSEGENKPGGGEKGAEIRPGTWKDRGSLRKPSLVDGLLLSIYRNHQRYRSSSLGESDTMTEHSTTSEPAVTRYRRCFLSSAASSSSRVVLRRFRLQGKNVAELKLLVSSLEASLSGQCALLVRELKKRDKLRHRRDQQNDVVTAVLHALSLKRSQDTRIRFSVAPLPGDSGFRQWHDAMMMCARLPGGIPQEFRRRLWLTLAEKHLQARGVSWPHAESFCFNEWSNPDDDELGDQIVKDLHRTGCSLFCGEEAEDNQAMLKRVLLAFARWNKGVGYCQGFNMLAAIILEVMERQESDALKVMIYLIEGVLPESYFANNLRGLSVDMAVFRDLLRLHLPHLSRHLEHLQHDAADLTTGTIYEPPLTNVFTMQWFLTLFSNCLPRDTVMRVWDLTFLQGNEVLLRTALAIWDGLARRILEVHSADEFYTVMGLLTREMLSTGLMDANKLVQTVVGMAPFPFPGLADLRDKYTYNITPWTQSVSSVAKRGLRLFYSDDDDDDNDEDNQTIAVATAFGLSGIFRKTAEINRGSSPVGGGGPVMSPGGFPAVSTPPPRLAHEGREITRPNLDISALKKQYARLRERQKQAHIILTASQQRVSSTLGSAGMVGTGSSGQRGTPLTMNHLLRGKKALTSKTKRVVPQGVIPVMKPKKKVERKLSDSSSNRPAPQQPSKQHLSNQGIPPHAHYQTLKCPPVSEGPKKMETLHWKDTPRRDRRASLPSGVKLLENSSPRGVLDVAVEMDDDEGDGDSGSSTSTELCDDDEEDKLSDLDPDTTTDPRPATTSPRLETVKEDSCVPSEVEGSASRQAKEDQNLKPVSYSSPTSDKQGPEVCSDPTLGTNNVESQTKDINQNQPNTQKLKSNQLHSENKLLLKSTTTETTKSDDTLQGSSVMKTSKDQENETPMWDLKAGIPLEDLLARKNLTAAEIIARIPFPSDVSFMKNASELAAKNSSVCPKTERSCSPSSSLHNVTPERSPVDSPLFRIPSPEVIHEPSLTTKASPCTSPSKSLTFSSSPSPRDSPVNKAPKTPTRSSTASPTENENFTGSIKWSLTGLPPISSSDIIMEASLIPPKSPKITVEDDKSNVFEIYEGYSGTVTSVKEFDEMTEENLKVIDLPEENTTKTHIHPSLSMDQLITVSEGESCVTESDINLEERIREIFGQVTSQDEESESIINSKETMNRDTVTENIDEVSIIKCSTNDSIEFPDFTLLNNSKLEVKSDEESDPLTPEVSASESGYLCLNKIDEQLTCVSEVGNFDQNKMCEEPLAETKAAADSPLVNGNELVSETLSTTESPIEERNELVLETSNSESPVKSILTTISGTSSWLSVMCMSVCKDVNFSPAASCSKSIMTNTICEDQNRIVSMSPGMEVLPVFSSVFNITNTTLSPAQVESHSELSVPSKRESPELTVSESELILEKEGSSIEPLTLIGLSTVSCVSPTTPSRSSPRLPSLSPVHPEARISEFSHVGFQNELSEFRKQLNTSFKISPVERDDVVSLLMVDKEKYGQNFKFDLPTSLSNEEPSSLFPSENFSSVKLSVVDSVSSPKNKTDGEAVSSSSHTDGVSPICFTVGTVSPLKTTPTTDTTVTFSLLTSQDICCSLAGSNLRGSLPLNLLSQETLANVISDDIPDLESSNNQVKVTLQENCQATLIEACTEMTEIKSPLNDFTVERVLPPLPSLEERISAILGTSTKMPPLVTECDDKTPEESQTVADRGGLFFIRSQSGFSWQPKAAQHVEKEEEEEEEKEKKEKEEVEKEEEKVEEEKEEQEQMQEHKESDVKEEWSEDNELEKKEIKRNENGTEESVWKRKAEEEISTNQSSTILTWEEQVSYPVGPLERDSSLSASLEGRLSLFTNTEYEEGEVFCSEINEGKDVKYSEDNDNEAETETDFFNGKDLSSEAIRQRLWRGVKSLSLDADVSMDPDVFCFLIEQSSKHCRKNKDEDRRTMPKRRNSEVALQELVKENTEIIERILKQKSLESATLGKNYTLPNTSDGESGSPKEPEKQSGLSTFIKLLREKSERESCPEPESHKTSPSDMAPTTTEPQDGAASSDSSIKVLGVKSSKQISPPYMKSLTPEKRSVCKKDENVTMLSPTQPITFNPFPTRNVPRQPKEITVKLGLYSPSKKTTTSS